LRKKGGGDRAHRAAPDCVLPRHRSGGHGERSRAGNAGGFFEYGTASGHYSDKTGGLNFAAGKGLGIVASFPQKLKNS